MGEDSRKSSPEATSQRSEMVKVNDTNISRLFQEPRHLLIFQIDAMSDVATGGDPFEL
eukprot:CAMPEP_0185732904 /NCGR_PEP_ID=MMETSP1171-20130828/17884_1 /TAXON_ID=374046 /ORGANISM="Helicotheca tamensis, Strain CCMP826" /LENGTH=57 /DNA_ID=CAMNT_0028402509 /DNA_START=127 /DNA_END=300 /DNA_ORIENTATION=+